MIIQVATALLAHYWFKNKEPSLTTAAWCLPFLPLAAPIIEGIFSQSPAPISSHSTSFSFGISGLVLEYTVFYSTLITSILIYRFSPYHPLAKYPGPLICRATKLWGVWVAIRGDNHRYTQRLHEQYGPIVRVGPNELSIADKDAIPHVLGNQGLPKGPLWDGRRFRQGDADKPYESLIDVRDAAIHHDLRKSWNGAFSAGCVKNYNELLGPRIRQLRDHLYARKDEGRPMDLAKWLSFFAFDFMGDLAFGGCFELMRDGGDVHGFWKAMEEGLELPAISQHVPWISPLLLSIPFISAKMQAFTQFGVQQSKKRLEMQTKNKDLFHYLYEVPADESGQQIEDQMDLVVSNSLLTIVAGSDTTATTLSAILCHIISDRRICKNLQKELDEAFPTNSLVDGWPEIEIDKLTKLSYLNAVINEGLRLVPAVPTSIQRAPQAGSGGKMLGDTKIFIPEGVAVNISPFSIHRDPRYFSPSPEAFIPERWLQASKGEYTTNKEAFIPFSYGPANCAGKALALVELRYTIATLVLCFDLQHASCKGASAQVLKQRAKDWVDSLKDRFVFGKSALPVDIISRKRRQ